MAWTTPRTFVAAAVLTAAQLNETRDNLKALLPLDQLAWTSYTPTLTQSGAVTKTVTRARYQQIGKTVTVQGLLAVTGSGTSSNPVTVSLPVTSATSSAMTIGSGHIFDTSAGSYFPAPECRLASTTTLNFISTGGQVLGSFGFTAALASGDEVAFFAVYEAA